MNTPFMPSVNGPRGWAGLMVFLAFCFGAASTGAFFPPDAWYASLQKPWWNPPAWVFGPVWTVLYAMMAVAAWRVWRCGGFPAQRRSLSWFFLQLLLNAAWTPIFFGLHRPGLAFLEMIFLWIAIVLTLRAFFIVDRLAGWLFMPYLAWVSFALGLNLTLWRLNP